MTVLVTIRGVMCPSHSAASVYRRPIENGRQSFRKRSCDNCATSRPYNEQNELNLIKSLSWPKTSESAKCDKYSSAPFALTGDGKKTPLIQHKVPHDRNYSR